MGWVVKKMGDTRRQRAGKLFATFKPIRELVRQLRAGEVDTVKGVPIMPEWSGGYVEVCPALEGWASCWQRINEAEGLGITATACERVAKALHYGKPLTVEEVEVFAQEVEAQAAAYAVMPLSVIRRHILTEQVAIEFEAIGIAA
jgi:hypothetical protein